MPVVTSIKPQKNKKRVNIYLDGKFGFGLDLQTFLKNTLKIEQELSEKEIEEIVKRGEFQSTYDKMLRFASLRPHSQREYETWLLKHKVHHSLKEELFNKLKHLEFLDDVKFAKWWVDQRIQFKSKSKRELVYELKAKGIDNKVVEEVLEDSEIDEKKLVTKLLEKKGRLWKHLQGFEKRKKMFQFLLQRGFDSETIRSVLGDFSDDLT